jgi:predicted TIM-barrel fold metal-dependent hydrolase
MNIKYYDCHCHVFNKDVIDLHLMANIFLSLPDILRKSDTPHDLERESTVYDKIKNKIHVLKRLINFLEAGFSKTDEDVFAKMQQTYGTEFAIAPLMFDLEFCFIGKRAYSPSELNANFKTIHKSIGPRVDEFLNQKKDFIKDVPEMISKSGSNKEQKEGLKNLKELEGLHGEVKEKISFLMDTHLKENQFLPKLTSSYKKQLEDILKLKEDFPSLVFPFIAIDPRRHGIIETFMQEIYPLNLFTGVKLYTPLGYSPTDEDLMKSGGLYEFCEKHQIPITAHHSHVGFATPLQHVEIFGDTFENGKIIPKHGFIKFSRAFSTGWVQERADKLNHPELWRKVLNTYPNLKLNLAHFGHDNEEWRKTVFEMMGTFRNLYTDFSRYTSIADLTYLKETYFCKASPEVKQKFLYGSDYYFDLLYIDSLKEYFDNFMTVFTADEFTIIAQTNAKRFLNLEQ